MEQPLGPTVSKKNICQNSCQTSKTKTKALRKANVSGNFWKLWMLRCPWHMCFSFEQCHDQWDCRCALRVERLIPNGPTTHRMCLTASNGLLGFLFSNGWMMLDGFWGTWFPVLFALWILIVATGQFQEASTPSRLVTCQHSTNRCILAATSCNF